MRGLFIVALLAVLALSSAFAPAPTFLGQTKTLPVSTTELEACRANSKKEKRLRNRENMRKFKKRGKTSRKKLMRKSLSAAARQQESEFIAKCFTMIGLTEEEKK